MDVLMPKFEISVPGLLRKRQTALFLLLCIFPETNCYNDGRSLCFCHFITHLLSSDDGHWCHCFNVSPNRKCMEIFRAYL